MDLHLITLPLDWDAEKDCRHFEGWQNSGPGAIHTEALWAQARFHHGNFLDAIGRALRCAYARDATLTHIELGCLTTAEKIEVVMDSVLSRPQVYADPIRILEDLRASQFAESERARILREYRRSGDKAWMYPVIELIDLCGAAAAELNDTISCEETEAQKAGVRVVRRETLRLDLAGSFALPPFRTPAKLDQVALAAVYLADQLLEFHPTCLADRFEAALLVVEGPPLGLFDRRRQSGPQAPSTPPCLHIGDGRYRQTQPSWDVQKNLVEGVGEFR